jgi:hypothetical protein
MLSREVMGGVGLAILWVNTFLVVLGAWRELMAIGARRRGLHALEPGETGIGVLEGRVAYGAGTQGRLACRRVDQIGRYAADDADRSAIAFSDGAYGGASFGGLIGVGATEVHVDATENTSVWVSAESMRAAAGCPDASTFEAAYEQARKARGFSRRVEAGVGEGDPVWIRGDLRRRGDGFVVSAPPDEPLLIAGVDPRAWCRGKAIALFAFVVGVLLVAAGCTALALYQPHLGRLRNIV